VAEVVTGNSKLLLRDPVGRWTEVWQTGLRNGLMGLGEGQLQRFVMRWARVIHLDLGQKGWRGQSLYSPGGPVTEDERTRRPSRQCGDGRAKGQRSSLANLSFLATLPVLYC
jgi:hypothetical protein